MKKLQAVIGLTLLFVSFEGVMAWGQMFQGYQGGPAVSAAFYVEQRQWPAGYGIRLYIPDRRTGDIHVSVEGNSLSIRSEGGEQSAPMGTSGPVFMQFGSFSQWLSLPADADMSQMKITSGEGVIDIFIPRKR